MMFGYATNETAEFMPLPIVLAHKLTKRLSEVRKNKIIDYLLPDGKAQVTVCYYPCGIPSHITTIVVSCQHKAEMALEKLEKDIYNEVIYSSIPAKYLNNDTKIFINPSGKFVTGGPKGDTGLTGRKIMVDTYGGFARNGGGAFSGKDASKVDRSASYAARYIAKNLVATGFVEKCEIQLAYAIGVAEPVSIDINTFNSSSIKEEYLINAVKKNFNLTPSGIINMLDLNKPQYQNTSKNGHFGHEEYSWEKLDKINDLINYIKPLY